MSKRSVEPSPAGWYDDPYEAGKLRYFDGTQWTDKAEPDTRQALAPHLLTTAVPGEDLPTAPSEPRTHGLRLAYTVVGLAAFIAIFNVVVRVPYAGLLLGALFQVGLAAIIAPRVSYRRVDAFAMLIPFWNLYLMGRLAWRLAYLPYRDWEPRPDEAGGWQRWQHPTHPQQPLYLPIPRQPATPTTTP